jgi:hypothetical protein
MPVPPHPEVCCPGPLGSGDGCRMPSTSKGAGTLSNVRNNAKSELAARVGSDHQVLELDAVQPLLIVTSAANGLID